MGKRNQSYLNPYNNNRYFNLIMEIHLDLDSKGFFISVSLSPTESISFDNTIKGHRVIKQRLIGKEKNNEPITATWETLEIIDGKPIKTYKVKWVDKGKYDLTNNEVWETIWEKPLTIKIKNKLLAFSLKINENKNQLDNIKTTLIELDNYLSKIIKDYI